MISVRATRKTGLLMMVGVGAFLLIYGLTAPAFRRDTSILGGLTAGLMYGGLPLVLAGIAWQHPVPGGAIAIAYSILSTVLLGIMTNTPVGFSPILYIYAGLMTIYIIGSILVIVSGRAGTSSSRGG